MRNRGKGLGKRPPDREECRKIGGGQHPASPAAAWPRRPSLAAPTEKLRLNQRPSLRKVTKVAAPISVPYHVVHAAEARLGQSSVAHCLSPPSRLIQPWAAPYLAGRPEH